MPFNELPESEILKDEIWYYLTKCFSTHYNVEKKMENEYIKMLLAALDSSNQFEYRGFYCQSSGSNDKRTWLVYGPDGKRLPHNGNHGFKNIEDAIKLIDSEFE